MPRWSANKESEGDLTRMALLIVVRTLTGRCCACSILYRGVIVIRWSNIYVMRFDLGLTVATILPVI